MAERIDSYLVRSGLAKSRERAKQLIKSGNVAVGGRVVRKPSFDVTEADRVELLAEDMHYVGRGALKLLYAFEAFDLNIRDRVCADIGASTGGFTQVMLENGARLVYAVDVGHCQLADILLNDKRVINCEGVNVKELKDDFFEYPIEFMSVDLSFISLSKVIPVLCSCLSQNGEAVVLIKPQFEAGRSALNKQGVVRDRKDHVTVLNSMLKLFEENSLAPAGLGPSPIHGGDGNIEYLCYVKKNGQGKDFDTKNIVNTAFD